MKLNVLRALLALVFGALPGTAPAVRAQSGALVDCHCMRSLPELKTNACVAYVPDLCALSLPCWLAPLPLTCTQNPAPGTPVGPGVHLITVLFTDSMRSAQPCDVVFSVTPPPGGCGPNACIPPPPGMVGWWPLDEGTGATVYADVSGSGNAALVESFGALGNPGSPTPIGGKVAGASYFYGPTVRGRAPNGPTLNFGTTSFSVDCWVNPLPFIVGRQPIVDKLWQPTPTSAFGYALAIVGGAVELRLGDGALATYTGPAIAPSLWNFVAVAVDRTANTVTFHVNGVTAAPQALVPAGSLNSGVDLLIGGAHNLNDGYGELAIDEVEIFNRILTGAEMTALWQADRDGKCKPTSPCTNSVVSIFCPTNLVVQACGSSAVVNYPAPTAATSCGTIVNIACVPPSGSNFPLGNTTVTCTATDSQGNSASCTFTVTVVGDTTPPACPPSAITVTGCPPVMPDFATNGLVTDNCTPVGSIVVTQNPPAGTVLPPGTTGVALVACDAAGNCTPCIVEVTAVYSGTPPAIVCPPDIVTTGYLNCGSNGTTVAYSPPQVVNGALASCTPPSGSFFPFGTTVVTCVATNLCGTNQCTFTVTVNYGGLVPPCVPPPSNMVLWLKFDETNGPTAFNASAGNHGTLAGAPVRTLGQWVLNSLCFNGASQYVQVSPYPAMQFGTNDFSVDAWVKPATLGNTVRTIVDHREENGGVVRGYSLFLSTNNAVGFQLADGTPTNYLFPWSVVPADGRWHHVAVSVKRNDPQGVRVYVDGVAAPNPGDPTSRPGSVTAGPCFPFRVGARSSSVTGLFPGCIDEVELFRRALTAAEVQSLLAAQCRGKCRIMCQVFSGIIPACWVGGNYYPFIFYNPLPVPQTLTWSVAPLPAGPGCTVPGPSFNPASGTITVPPYGANLTNLFVTFPGGLNVDDCACYRLTIVSADGSQQMICDGKICLPRHFGVCAAPAQPVAVATNDTPAIAGFAVGGTGSSPIPLHGPMIFLRSPEGEIVSATPLPDFVVPPAGAVPIEVTHEIVLPGYDPGRVYRLTFEADIDGTGVYQVLGEQAVMNALPATESENPLTIETGADGRIIIKWYKPCATVEINPHLGNPSGWTPLKVTSPWEIAPEELGETLFIRLRE